MPGGDGFYLGPPPQSPAPGKDATAEALAAVVTAMSSAFSTLAARPQAVADPAVGELRGQVQRAEDRIQELVGRLQEERQSHWQEVYQRDQQELKDQLQHLALQVAQPKAGDLEQMLKTFNTFEGLAGILGWQRQGTATAYNLAEKTITEALSRIPVRPGRAQEVHDTALAERQAKADATLAQARHGEVQRAEGLLSRAEKMRQERLAGFAGVGRVQA